MKRRKGKKGECTGEIKEGKGDGKEESEGRKARTGVGKGE